MAIDLKYPLVICYIHSYLTWPLKIIEIVIFSSKDGGFSMIVLVYQRVSETLLAETG